MKKAFLFSTIFRISPFVFGWHLGCTKRVSNSKSSPVKVLFSFCLVFCQFEAGVAYKKVGYEKNRVNFWSVWRPLCYYCYYYFIGFILIQTSKCCNIVFVGILSYAFSLFIFTEKNDFLWNFSSLSLPLKNLAPRLSSFCNYSSLIVYRNYVSLLFTEKFPGLFK